MSTRIEIKAECAPSINLLIQNCCDPLIEEIISIGNIMNFKEGDVIMDYGKKIKSCSLFDLFWMLGTNSKTIIREVPKKVFFLCLIFLKYNSKVVLNKTVSLFKVLHL